MGSLSDDYMKKIGIELTNPDTGNSGKLLKYFSSNATFELDNNESIDVNKVADNELLKITRALAPYSYDQIMEDKFIAEYRTQYGTLENAGDVFFTINDLRNRIYNLYYKRKHKKAKAIRDSVWENK